MLGNPSSRRQEARMISENLADRSTTFWFSGRDLPSYFKVEFTLPEIVDILREAEAKKLSERGDYQI